MASYNRDTILNDLRHYVIEVSFTKVNGENRIMRCTLRPDLLPEDYAEHADREKEFHASNPDTITVWDVQKGGWRSFHISSVIYVQNVDENYV